MSSEYQVKFIEAKTRPSSEVEEYVLFEQHRGGGRPSVFSKPEMIDVESGEEIPVHSDNIVLILKAMRPTGIVFSQKGDVFYVGFLNGDRNNIKTMRIYRRGAAIPMIIIDILRWGVRHLQFVAFCNLKLQHLLYGHSFEITSVFELSIYNCIIEDEETANLLTHIFRRCHLLKFALEKCSGDYTALFIEKLFCNTNYISRFIINNSFNGIVTDALRSMFHKIICPKSHEFIFELHNICGNLYNTFLCIAAVATHGAHARTLVIRDMQKNVDIKDLFDSLHRSQIDELRIEYSENFDGYALLLSRQVLVPKCFKTLRIDHFRSNAPPSEIASCFAVAKLQKLRIKYTPSIESGFIKDFYIRLRKLNPSLDFKLVNMGDLIELEL